MRKIVSIILVVTILFSFAGCAMEEEQQVQFLAIQTTPNETSGNASSNETGGNTSMDENSGQATQGQQPTELKFQYSSKTHYEFLSGKLELSISNPRVVTQRDDMPGGDFDSAYAGIWNDGEVTEYVCYSPRFPSFVFEDGSFVEGAKLIVMDVTVTNIDAKMRTQKDADAEGKGGGLYTDPYIFRVGSLLSFTDTAKATDMISVFGGVSSDGNYPQLNATYFSLLNNCEEHPFAFRVAPGESISFSIGIVMGNNEDGSERDLSTIAARITFAEHIGGMKSDVYYVSLGLGGK